MNIQQVKRKIGLILVHLNIFLLRKGFIKSVNLSTNTTLIKYIPKLMGWRYPISIGKESMINLKYNTKEYREATTNDHT